MPHQLANPDDLDNLRIDVCISRPGLTRRWKFLFHNAGKLLAELRGWRALPPADIWLSWGTTDARTAKLVERAIRELGVEISKETA